jgi:uncharacterized protein (TIGR03435 family)
MPAMKNIKMKQRDGMLQPLLAERFSLRCHWETRMLPIEKLQVAGKSAQLKDVTSSGNSKNERVGDATTGAGSMVTTPAGRVIARAIAMETLASYLEREVQKDVIDETGLTGKYDFEMQLPSSQSTATAAGDGGSPFQDSRSELIQDGLAQIGLKLVSAKAEAQVLVIDALQPPTPN